MPYQSDLYIEASHADYKERLEEKKPRSWLKSVSAFANTEGGHLIFGVKNEPREVVGLENPQFVVSKLTELIKARIDPTPRYRIREIEIEGKSCIDLEVQDGPAYPYYYAFDGSHTAYVRRNQVISDVFSRLGFMERRGSGIDRILNSYVEVAQKPTFYSDADFFIVTLPNRSVATPAQMMVQDLATSSESLATSLEEAAIPARQLAPSVTEDELTNLKNVLDGFRLSQSTKTRTVELFRRYGYQYSFHSSNVADIFGVKRAAATAILRRLREYGIVDSPQYGAYRFVKNQQR